FLEPLFVVYSFSTTEDCAFGADSVKPFADFKLAPLGDNGGPTLTRMPQTGSVLIDYVSTVDCAVPDDQRLVTRPIGAGCDTGAVEAPIPVIPTDCAATSVGFASAWVHQQQQQVKVVGKNVSANPTRCKVTLIVKRISPK